MAPIWTCFLPESTCLLLEEFLPFKCTANLPLPYQVNFVVIKLGRYFNYFNVRSIKGIFLCCYQTQQIFHLWYHTCFFEGAASLTNWRKSRKNDVANHHLWHDILASPRIPKIRCHHHYHFELILKLPSHHKSSLWRLVMTWRHFNSHQSSLILKLRFFIIFTHNNPHLWVQTTFMSLGFTM